MLVNESQIRALIRLLADEDEKIVHTISGKLIDIGSSAVPLLQEAEIEQPEMAERIASVLEEIRGGKLEDELLEQAALPDDRMDLEQAAFLIARYAYPSLDASAYSRQLDEMAQEVQDRIGPRASGEETVKTLNRYLFTEQGFKGNTKNYYEVENTYLNRVIDRRTGIPISLSMVYLLIGKRLRLPVHGIGMPGHFLGKSTSQIATRFSSIALMEGPCSPKRTVCDFSRKPATGATKSISSTARFARSFRACSRIFSRFMPRSRIPLNRPA